MPRMFKRAQSEVQQGTSKSNLLRRFGGKFKKAFTKKQSQAQTTNGTHVDEAQVSKPANSTFPGTWIKQTGPVVSHAHTDIGAKTRISGPSSANAILGRHPNLQAGLKLTLRLLEDTKENLPVAKGFELNDRSQDGPTTAPPKHAASSLASKTQDAHQETRLQDPLGVESSGSPNSKCSTPSCTRGLNIDRKFLRRSNSVPSSPLSPTTGASSDTLYNSPRISDTPASPSLLKFRQALDEHREWSQKCQKALIDHLEGEEKGNRDAEWAALVEWTKISYTAMVKKAEHERSEARRRLELRCREIRAMKREMKDLKKSLEDAKSQLVEQSDTESVDEDEGGVLLPNTITVPTGQVEGVHENTYGAPQEIRELERCISLVNERMEKAKPSKKKAAEEEKKLQRALKQQLMEDSIPEAPVHLEAGPSAAMGGFREEEPSQMTFGIRGPNKAPSADVILHQNNNIALQNMLEHTRGVMNEMQMEAVQKDEEVKKLKAENHFAQLEVGHCNAANAGYRAAMEDDNPARTAHLDGLLKRKDEAYAELEKRAAECAKQLAKEERLRAVEDVYSYKNIQGLRKELAHRLNIIGALTESRDVLKRQNDHVFEMFKGKVFEKDMREAFFRDYEMIQNDNTLLIKMINERRSYVRDAEKKVADLEAEMILKQHGANTDKFEYRQTQQNLNGLIYINHQLNAKIDFQDEIREELREDLEGQLKQQAAEMQELLQSGANDWLQRRQQAMGRRIALQNGQIKDLNALANHWRMRAMEQQDGFCPMWNWDEVPDWDAEDARWRLWHAERMVEKLQRERRQLIREGKKPETREPEHDGSNWLRGRAEATRVMEEFVDVEE